MSDSDHKAISPVDAGVSFERHQTAMRAAWSPEIRAYADALAKEIDLARSFESASRQLSPRPFDDGDVSPVTERP